MRKFMVLRLILILVGLSYQANGMFGLTGTHNELESQLSTLNSKLTTLKESLSSLLSNLISLKSMFLGKKASEKISTQQSLEPVILFDNARVNITFDPHGEVFRADIISVDGELCAHVTLTKNEDKGTIEILEDPFDKIKGSWYNSKVYELEKVVWEHEDKKEGFNIINPNGGNFAFYKVMQKDFDKLDSTNPYKNKVEYVGKYVPPDVFMDMGQGVLEWDSPGFAVDHQPAPPWIEVAVRAFAEVLWLLAHGYDLFENQIFITIVHGNITVQHFENDKNAALVNAANSSMRGGGGIDGVLHSENGAGKFLWAEEEAGKLTCPTGQARLTMGHKLAPLRIIHTVGPKGVNEQKLREAYTNCLVLADNPMLSSNFNAGQIITTKDKKHTKIITQKNLDSAVKPITAIAFNCISTGIFGYDIQLATPVALQAVFDYLQDHPTTKIREVRFVVFLGKEYDIYQKELKKREDSNLIERAWIMPDLKLQKSSIGGQGAAQACICFKYTKK